MSGLSKVVLVVVVHGQYCMVNENCLYKAILKIDFPKYSTSPFFTVLFYILRFFLPPDKKLKIYDQV